MPSHRGRSSPQRWAGSARSATTPAAPIRGARRPRALTGAHAGRPHEIVSWTAVAERVPRRPRGRTAASPGRGDRGPDRDRDDALDRRRSPTVTPRTSRQHLDEILRLLPDGAGHVERVRPARPGRAAVPGRRAGRRAGHPVRGRVRRRGTGRTRGRRRGSWPARAAGSPGPGDPRKRPCSRAAPRRPQRPTGSSSTSTPPPSAPAQGLGRAAGGQAAAGGRALPAGARAGPAQRHARGGRGAAHRAGAGRGAPRSACRGPTGTATEARQVLASCPDPGYVWADPRADSNPPRRSTTAWRLTRRQAEILALLAEALTTAEIGERLKLSPADRGGAPADALPQDRRALPHCGRALRGRARLDYRSSRTVIISPTEGTRRKDGAAR